MTKKLLLCISLLLSGSINTTFAMAPRQRVATLSLTTKKQCVTLFKQHKPLGSHGYKTVTGNYAQRGQRASPLQALSLLSKKSTPTSVVTKPFVTLTKTQEQLLERLKHAARQEDLATMDETFEFIKRKFPALVPQAEKIVKSAKEFANLEYLDPPLHQLMFTTLLEKRAHNYTLSFNPKTEPPTLSWWEIIWGKEFKYGLRLFSWLFHPQNMKLYCDAPLSLQDTSLLFEEWKTYVATMYDHGYNREQALKILQDNIVRWPIRDGRLHHDNMKLIGDNYEKTIEQAMKDYPTLRKIIQGSFIRFNTTEARQSDAAALAAEAHRKVLVQDHQVMLDRLLRHFAQNYYSIYL